LVLCPGYVCRSDVATFVAQVQDDPDLVLKARGRLLEADLFRTRELLDIYDPGESRKVTENGLARELRKAGFRQVNHGKQIERKRKKVKTSHGRLWAIRNCEQALRRSPQALFEQYTRELEQRRSISRYYANQYPGETEQPTYKRKNDA
jgi:hypothetical protein